VRDVIALLLVGVSLGERDQRALEAVALAKVGGRDAVARARVRTPASIQPQACA